MLQKLSKQDFPILLLIAVGIQGLALDLARVAGTISPWTEAGILRGMLNMLIAVVAICGFAYSAYLRRVSVHLRIIVGVATYIAAHVHWLHLLEHNPDSPWMPLAVWGAPTGAFLLAVILRTKTAEALPAE